jgi:CRISPR/Cas system CMR-associated protein Cmr5 small subunit
MDSETVEAFKSIINRISDDAIDEMAEDGEELNSTTYMAKMAVKFERYAELMG